MSLTSLPCYFHQHTWVPELHLRSQLRLWSLPELCWTCAGLQLSHNCAWPGIQTSIYRWISQLPLALPSSCGPVGRLMELTLTYRLTSWLSFRPALSPSRCLICTPGWTWPPSLDRCSLPCFDTVGLAPTLLWDARCCRSHLPRESSLVRAAF